MLVRREQEIRAFVPRDYWEVRGDLRDRRRAEQFDRRRWRRRQAIRRASATRGARRRASSRAATSAAGEPRSGRGSSGCGRSTVREPPPLLFDLTSLQRTANRRFGLRATAHARDRAGAVRAPQGPHLPAHRLAPPARATSRRSCPSCSRRSPRCPTTRRSRRRCSRRRRALAAASFDDGKVQRPPRDRPDRQAACASRRSIATSARIFDLVARRFLGAFHPDAEFALTEVVIRVGAPAAAEPRAARRARGDARCERATILVTALPPPPDRYLARGRVRLVAGWQAVAASMTTRGGRDEPRRRRRRRRRPATRCRRSPRASALDGAVRSRSRSRPRPPPRYTEATLLGAMESAGKAIDDEALRAAMKDSGPRHAGHARRDHRDAAPARLHRARRAEPRARRRSGIGLDRGAAGREPRLARADRRPGRRGSRGSRAARRRAPRSWRTSRATCARPSRRSAARRPRSSRRRWPRMRRLSAAAALRRHGARRLARLHLRGGLRL